MPFINRCGGGAGKTHGIYDIISQISGFQDVITINGKTRNNILPQPSNFSDDTKYFKEESSYKMNYGEVNDAENGMALILTPAATSSPGNNSTTISIEFDPRSASEEVYLLALRVKANANINPKYTPSVGLERYMEGGSSTDVITDYIPFRPLDEFRTYYFVFKKPPKDYVYKVKVVTSSTGNRPTYYFDWVALYNITGAEVNAENMMLCV